MIEGQRDSRFLWGLTCVVLALHMTGANAQPLCTSVTDEDCGDGYVASRRSGVTCAFDPCAVAIQGLGDHNDCCMSEIITLNCSDVEEGKPLQIIGQFDETDTFYGSHISRLNILTGVYDLLYEIFANITSPAHIQANACAVNPLDQTNYCLLRFADETYYVARLDATPQVQFVAQLDVPKYSVSATINEEGDYIIYMSVSSQARYYKLNETHLLPSYADIADVPLYAEADLEWIVHDNVLKNLDIVVVNGDFDGLGQAMWLFGLASARSFESDAYNKGLLTKASGPGFGIGYILNTSYNNQSLAPTSGGFGAGWMYYDNIIFGSNHGNGVFLAEMDIDEGNVYLSRVGLSDSTDQNDGMNCGPPALLPFASCQARTGPGSRPTVDSDCGPGWVVDTSSNLVCDFDPTIGLGCNTGDENQPDQSKCCNLDCTPPYFTCNDHGNAISNLRDTSCSCNCDVGYAGANCDECAPAYTGYPNCVPTLAPTMVPTSSAPSTSPSTSPTLSPSTSNPTANPTSAPTLSPDLSINSVTEYEGSTATLTVTLSRIHDEDVSVDWETIDGTAVAPGDYVADSGTLVIPAGSLSGTINVTLNTDTNHNEVEELLYVLLTNAQNSYISGGPGIVRIINLPAFSITDVIVEEGEDAILTISQSSSVAFTTSIDWSTVDGTAVAGADYTSDFGTLTFAPGETSKNISISTSVDEVLESGEIFNVFLSNPVNSVIFDDTGTVTILDGARLSIGDAVVPEGGVAQLNITLDKPATHSVTVNWATSPNTAVVGDYDSSSGSVTFAPGQTSIAFPVQTNLDSSFEGDETFFVVLSSPSGAAIEDGSGTVTIYDVPDITINDAVVVEGQGVDIVVTLSHPSSQLVAVDWTNPPDSATVVGGDYDPDSGTITFPPGTTEVTISLSTNPDSIDEGDENFNVQLSGANGGNILDNTGVVTIIDAPGVFINDAVVPEGGVAELTISLSHASTTYTTIDWATADSSATSANGDYTSASGSVTFAPGQTSVSLYVQTLLDGLNEGSEQFLVVLSNPVNLSIVDGTGTVTISDVPGITVSDAVTPEGTDVFVSICLTHVTGSPVTVDWVDSAGTATPNATENSGDDPDYESASGTVTIPAGQLCTQISITVPDDGIQEDSEGFNIVLRNPSSNAFILDDTGDVIIEESLNRGYVPTTTTASSKSYGSKSGGSKSGGKSMGSMGGKSIGGSRGSKSGGKSRGSKSSRGKSSGSKSSGSKSSGSKSSGSKSNGGTDGGSKSVTSGYDFNFSTKRSAYQGMNDSVEAAGSNGKLLVLVSAGCFLLAAYAVATLRTARKTQIMRKYAVLLGFRIPHLVDEATPLWADTFDNEFTSTPVSDISHFDDVTPSLLKPKNCAQSQ